MLWMYATSQKIIRMVNESTGWHMMAPNSLLGPCFHDQQVTNCQKLSRVQYEVEVFSVQLRSNKTGSWQKGMIQCEVIVEPGWLSWFRSAVASHWICRNYRHYCIYLSATGICTCYERRFSTSQKFIRMVNESMGWHMMAPNSLLGPCFHDQQVTNCQKLSRVQHEVEVFSVQLHSNKTLDNHCLLH